MPELDWVSIDDQAWITGNALVDAAPAAILVAHNDPATGSQCMQSPSHIGLHAIGSRHPLSIVASPGRTGSLACGACAWHGYITDGHWVPA